MCQFGASPRFTVTLLFKKYVKLEPLTDGKALFILSILFSLTFLTLLWSSVYIMIYQEMTTLLVFKSFKRISLSFNRIHDSG